MTDQIDQNRKNGKEYLNNTINRLELIELYSVNRQKNTFFLNTSETFTKISQDLSHKEFNKF